MIRKGTRVSWKWGNGKAEGKVIDTYAKKVKKVLDGNEIVRNGEEGNKVLLIEQEDGSQVIKKESEVSRIDS